MLWSRAEFENDKRRYEQSLEDLREAGLPDDHPMVRRFLRRIATVDRVLDGDLNGLIEEEPDGPAEPA